MSIELKVPDLGESISEVYIGAWLKSKGEPVNKDDPLVELESDKATVELPAPASGVITHVLKAAGETAQIGEVIGRMDAAEAGARTAKSSKEVPKEVASHAPASDSVRIMPAARRALAEHDLSANAVITTGPGGRLLKEDVMRHVSGARQKQQDPPAKSSPEHRQKETVPMSPMRRRIAERLVQAQQTTAQLTTFNEVDLSRVVSLRAQYKEAFQEKHQIKLGFMSFFVHAAIDALKQFPELNAQIEGTDIVYHNYYDVGIAVSTGKGLAVPVLRNAERMGFAQIEKSIGDFAERAKLNKLSLKELQGGTFTISNGGVFGSLLSTPIINPPQCGILGMHAIQNRPVASDGEIVIRPMMYMALSYDHRIVDGREAVTFLKRIKEVLEAPTRMLLEV